MDLQRFFILNLGPTGEPCWDDIAGFSHHKIFRGMVSGAGGYGVFFGL